MKLKNNFFYTLREKAKDEDSISGNLLVQGGFIKKTSAGVYMFMPIGYKVLKKIENIIRDEMNKAGAVEMLMPSLIASEYYEKSGRMANFGSSVYQLKDRNNKHMILGPTHEELFAYAAKNMIKSYKHLPFNLYQFQTKFRDEPRARYGLIRVKEFCMKDAYSFDIDEAGLDKSYQLMDKAYRNIFDRLKIKYKVVKADTGVMGGLLSEEFQALSEIGEDVLVYNDECNFSSNIEIAPCFTEIKETSNKKGEFKQIYTPNAKSIEEVCNYLGLNSTSFLKTLIYNVDGKLYAVSLRGDREANETKILKLLKGNEITLASNEEIEKQVNTSVGYIGPVGLNIDVIIDNEVLNMEDFISGANVKDYHLQNTNIKDFEYKYAADIRKIEAGDLTINCPYPVKLTKGIEIGNIFKLGLKYSESMNLTYLDSENKNQEVWMGSYGIGLGRCMSAIIEQNNDDKGIIWPTEIAPYQIALVIVNTKDETQNTLANKLYEELIARNYDVLLDDRDERPGVKFNDMDLIGIPHRITIGRKAVDSIVEYKNRSESDNFEYSINELLDNIKNIIK